MMRILYIEDDAHAAENLRLFLEAMGHESKGAATGQQALQLLSEPFDLVFCDLQLPDCNGIQLIAQIKQCLPSAPIVALTGFARAEERIHCINAGCSDCLIKPYNFTQLLDIIRRYGDNTHMQSTT